MCYYKHLITSEREKLLKLKSAGYSITAIAREMGRNKGTISRELKRNSTNGEYWPSQADKKYRERRKSCKPKKKLDNEELLQHVKSRLLLAQWSPEQIAGRLKEQSGICIISYSTIYRAIYSGMLCEQGKSTHAIVRKLRQRGKRRRKHNKEERRGKIIISHNIDERPAEADKRTTVGHFEADTVAGKQGKSCLVTMVDRKSRYLVCTKAAGKNATAVRDAIIDMFANGQALSGTQIHKSDNAVNLVKTNSIKVSAFGKVFAKETVGILISATLPGLIRRSKVERHAIQCFCDFLMFGKFLAPIRRD